MPPQLNGNVSISTRADLGGLGASEGALVTWTIPADLRRTLLDGSHGPRPSGTIVQPLNSATAARTDNHAASWWVLALVLCLALFLVSRLKSNDKN